VGTFFVARLGSIRKSEGGKGRRKGERGKGKGKLAEQLKR